MEVIKAIRTRKSIRAFRPDPVPKAILTELIEMCLRAPSWGNTQPWEFAILGGQVMEEVKSRLVDRIASHAKPNPDIAMPSFGDSYKQRRSDNTSKMYDALGIGREEDEKRREWGKKSARFFDAPNGIILYMDRSLTTYSVMDIGILLQTIMLAASSYGLGTCPQAVVVFHPDILREALGILPTKLIVVGLAVGYPDWDAPVNNFPTLREPLETFASWHGFELRQENQTRP